jgi:hypothetical protein
MLFNISITYSYESEAESLKPYYVTISIYVKKGAEGKRVMAKILKEHCTKRRRIV